MSNNNFTETFSDGAALTQLELETAFKSLTLDIGNTTQMTTGSTSGTFLKSNGDGVAASWGTPSDPLGPFAIRNYGLSTSISSGALTVALKTNAGNTPSSGDAIDVPFSNNGATTATYSALQVTGALSFTITASATLGFTGTSTNRVFVYGVNNSGTIRIAVSARADLDTGATITPVAMSSAADSATALYATATTAVVCRLLGWVDAALNSSGQWQTASHCGVRNNAGSADEVLTGVTSVGANKVINAYTRPSVSGSATAAVRSVAISNSSGTFSFSGTTSQQTVTNLVVSITTSGRPVRLDLINDDATNPAFIGTSAATNSYIRFYRDGSTISTHTVNPSGTTGYNLPCTMFHHVDVVAAGTYRYNVTMQVASGTGIVRQTKLVAYEL